MMDYRLENLSANDFERLVNTLCQQFLGMGVVSFAEGKDGGRDGRFEGIANKYPSENSPWSGKFIIQAKHTSNSQGSCADDDFFKNKTSLINKEIPKIKTLKRQGEIDNYLLFTNRKESAKREEIRAHVQNETGLSQVDIIGANTLSNWLEQSTEIQRLFKLGIYAMPIEFYDKDIKEVICIFYDGLCRTDRVGKPVLDRPAIDDKNKLNKLSPSYYENIIKDDLNRYHRKITDFLEDPINSDYAVKYEDTTLELKRVIETHCKQYPSFEFIFEYLAKYMLNKESEKLAKYRNIIPAFFHFMYYQCDIGKEK